MILVREKTYFLLSSVVKAEKIVYVYYEQNLNDFFLLKAGEPALNAKLLKKFFRPGCAKYEGKNGCKKKSIKRN